MASHLHRQLGRDYAARQLRAEHQPTRFEHIATVICGVVGFGTLAVCLVFYVVTA